tara:strand:- start:257 stop:463 length:207 start_codon:yes stop_codon:yes gene_type:complete
MQRLGQKSVRHRASFGQKSIHNFAKLGQKALAPAAVIGAMAAPEIALPLELGAMAIKPVLKGIQKASR